MKKSILLGLMLVGTMVLAQDTMSSNNYLSLRKLSKEHYISNQLLFYCRPVTTSEKLATNPQWLSSLMISSTGDTLNLTACYDSEQGLIDVKLNKNLYRLYPEKVAAILLGNKVLVTADKEENGSQFSSYFELSYEGTFSLLQKDNIRYIWKPDQTVEKIARSKRQFAQIFAPYQRETLNFINSNRLKLNRKADLIQILNYANSNFNFSRQLD